ncbi:MAG TPA: thiamine phosphate synthase [Vicinamibacterales bacterium]|nr:thiamine phosphate synthase [Vicinamibacterales bacterium]
MKSPVSRLNAIVDVEAAERARWRPVDLARAFLDGGATSLQLRGKTVSSARLLEDASAIAALAREAGAVFVVNDRADIARLSGADGVHVGQDDLAPDAVRRIVGDRAIVGLSTHTVEQLDAALRAPIDYVAIGPVFGTSTKDTGYAAIGLSLVRDAAARAKTAGLPLVAIGGITLDRAAEVIDAGAASVAVIGDLVASGDPAARVRAYVTRLANV